MRPDITRWQAPPINPQLEHNDLHLWRFRIDLSAAAATSLRQYLSADEVARAERFIRLPHQIKFVTARYGLRMILAGYLKNSPAAIDFAYSQQGKPSLNKSHQSDIKFNLSHSGDWATLAVTAGSDVGVDIEVVVNKDNLEQLGDYAFDQTEQRLFASFSPARQQRGFYRLWTAKEARLKMIGVGLSELRASCSPCFLHFFPIAKKYLVALATDTDVRKIIRYHYCFGADH